MFSCLCLNILIKTDSTDLQKVTSDFLNLNEDELKDVFFQQDLYQVTKLKNITKIHPNLVHSRNVANWNISCCINCIKETYAVHKEKGASCVLISSKLLDSKLIERIRAEQLELSKVFNIIVNPTDTRESRENILKLYKNGESDAILKAIRETMSEFLRKETLAVEERIKKYSDEQYEILNNLKDMAYEEHDMLVKLIQSLSDQTKPESTNNPMGSTEIDETLNNSFNLSEQINIKSIEKLKQTRHTPKRQRSTPAAPVSSFDAEGLFDFEGSDGINSRSESDIGDSDKDDKDERVSIVRSRLSKGNIAKSLPMDIPTFLSQARNNSTEDLDDIPQDDNLDIAASIKALAKSVHGDAVFGELPRPRLSTQI